MAAIYLADDYDHDAEAPARSAEPLREHELEEIYEEMLNECHELVRIGDLEYLPSRVLRECDPIAYRCGFHDWMDAELSDGNLIEV